MNRGGYKKKFHKNEGKRSYEPKYQNIYRRNMVHSKQQQIKELDVGISEYINDSKGFSGIIKARFSDFQVNEIGLDGETVKLTFIEIPKEFASNTNSDLAVDYKTLNNPLKHVTNNQWDEIISLLTLPEEKVVTLNVTNMGKEDRREIHQTINTVFKNQITGTTISKDGENLIQFKKHLKGDTNDTRTRWPSDIGEYVHFLVFKESMDTLEAIYKIADSLKMRASLFTYAGVKDRRAKTTQWVCVRKVDPNRLLKATKRIKNLQIGNFIFKTEPLKLGQLKGNRFRIALRNVTGDDVLITEAMTSLKNNGFINYYGLQRFGNDKEVPTFHIGVQLMLGNWKEACSLILKPKSSDDPFLDITIAKKVYQETENAQKAQECFRRNRNKCVESKLLGGLAKAHKNDYVNALESIPRNMRLLYIHSFQSLIWNKIVSRRLKEYGIKTIVGDLVLMPGNNLNSEMELSEDEDNIAEDKSQSSYIAPEVKILTQENVNDFTIFDVVLPLPGYDIKYPENDMKKWYKEILESYGLSLEMPKQRARTYTLSGAYRKIIVKVENLSWKILNYNDPTENLIRSDLEELNKLPEPQDVPDGKYKALVIDFALQSSCYATMALREILKTDTSSSSHAKLNNYHLNLNDEAQENSSADTEQKQENENISHSCHQKTLKHKASEEASESVSKKIKTDNIEEESF